MMSYFTLMVMCIVAVVVLMMNIVIANRLRNPGLKWLLTGLFTFAMLRYFTLIIYGDSPSLVQLQGLQRFYLSTTLSLSATTALAIWYITPHFREKITYGGFLAFFLPWIAFFSYVIVTQPTEIVMGESFGYELAILEPFQTYFSLAQGAYVAIVILICLNCLLFYKHPVLRSQYLFLIIAQLGLTFDGLSVVYNIETRLFHPFIVTEIVAFLAVYYALLHKPLDTKKKA
ncbi:MAG: hypothetical protein ATN33_07920 [Epulopiscium sp. Nele67-Bin001]|nr:MAG: hypothetical protein BEN18_05400 [Epulopiscium sp. Nuni2H_MBin001]OON92132.1 MAG: hypothetical protein ATN33_07920 [Epulopiscium sp. Nele67-Bin001]